MLRLVLKSAPLAAAIAAPVARRHIAVFTEQSDVLANNAKHRKFGSNVWFEVEDAWWTKSISALKSGEQPTQAPIQRRIELFNIDQVTQRPADLDNRSVHSSVRTLAPYSQSFQDELEARSKVHGFASKWWLSEREISKRGLNLRHNARPVVVMMRTTGQLLNVEQFEKPQELSRVPLSGATKKPFAKALQETLKADIAKNNYPTGLYFTLKQLEGLDLAGLVKPESQPVEHSIAREGLTLYNAEEVSNHEAILKELQRFPTENDAYLVTGKAVGAGMLSKIHAAGSGFKSKYWLTNRDIEARRFKLLPTAKGIEFESKEPNKVLLYSVHQLSNPAAGFKKAGTRAL